MVYKIPITPEVSVLNIVIDKLVEKRYPNEEELDDFLDKVVNETWDKWYLEVVDHWGISPANKEFFDAMVIASSITIWQKLLEEKE